MPGLPDATIEALHQIRSLIVAVEDASATSGNLYATSGIGRHVRHVVDRFRAFQTGLQSGVVNYNVRRRECALEQQSELALLEIESLVSWLRSTTMNELPLTVESEISCLRTASMDCP